jgi:transposase
LDTLFIGYDTDNKENDMQRKSYTREFKIRAVQLMGESSKPICRLAEELGVSENNLYNWRKQFREKADNAFSNQPRLDEKELEIRQLKDRGADHERSPKALKRSTEVKESFR